MAKATMVGNGGLKRLNFIPVQADVEQKEKPATTTGTAEVNTPPKTKPATVYPPPGSSRFSSGRYGWTFGTVVSVH